MSDNPKYFTKNAATNNTIDSVNVAEGTMQTADVNNGLRGSMAVIAPPMDMGNTPGAILIDDIAESTPDAGVRIDGLLIKDGGLPGLPTTQAVPVGAMFDYGGAAAPTNYLLCDGTAVSRTTYDDLFSAIGVNYGPGDGSTTFNLPDRQDNFSMGASVSNALGSAGGATGFVMTLANLIIHGHPTRIRAVADGSPSADIDGGFMLNNNADSDFPPNNGAVGATAGDQIGGGGSATPDPIPTIPPFVANNVIIKAISG